MSITEVSNSFKVLDNVCNECNFLVCRCLSNVISPFISNESSPENTEYVNVNSNDETHLINSQLSAHFSNNLTDGLSEGQSSSGDSIEGISDETVANLRLCKKGMNMGFLNIQGLSSKFSEIQILLTSEENKNLHIFSMCESKLNNSKLTSAFKVQGFHLPFRKDNHTNCGGGILVYVKDHIMAKRREDLESNDIACLWLEISPSKGKSFLLGSLYRNPTERVEWMDRFEQFFENVLNEGKEIILLGDFNKDLLNPNAHREWLVLTESLGLSQLVTQPTRVTTNTSTLIDHIYSSHEDNLSKESVCKIGISDHFAVVCNRKLNSSYKNNSHKSITYGSFKRFEENNFLNDLAVLPWDSIERYANIDDALEALYSLFVETINKHAPIKKHRIKKDIQPDWLNSEILDIMKDRDKLKQEKI